VLLLPLHLQHLRWWDCGQYDIVLCTRLLLLQAASLCGNDVCRWELSPLSRATCAYRTALLACLMLLRRVVTLASCTHNSYVRDATLPRRCGRVECRLRSEVVDHEWWC
jgi:hypothetical protein